MFPTIFKFYFEGEEKRREIIKYREAETYQREKKGRERRKKTHIKDASHQFTFNTPLHTPILRTPAKRGLEVKEEEGLP